MGVKLLNVVSMIPTSSGMILRIADKILSIQGKSIAQIFGRLRPLLSGEWSIQDICRHLPEPQAARITEFVGHLAAAGMIRERSAQENFEQSLISPRLNTYVSRIEIHNTSPVFAYRNFCRETLRIYGDERLAGFLIDGARVVGLSNTTYQAEPVARHRYSSHLGSTLETVNSVCGCNHGKRPFCNVIAARLFEHEQICRLITAWEKTSQCVNAYFLSCPDRVLVGVLPSHGAMGIQHMLSEYGRRMREAHSFLANPRRLFVIAAHILMLLLIDLYTGSATQDDWMPILEISESGKNIRKRPFPKWTYIRNARFRTLNLRSEIPRIQFQTIGAKVRLAQSMQGHLVDSYTGLIRTIDEGELPQIPHHQCAVIYRNSGSDADVYLNDSGRDAADARISVMLRSIEHFLAQVTPHDRLLRRYPHSIAHGGEVAVVFAAGINGKQRVHIDAIYRVLAAYADRCEMWQRPENMEKIFDLAPLSWAYLRDIGELDAVTYQRNLVKSDVEVIRFKYADKTISVVAGNGNGIWELGLRDVWSYIGGTKSCPATCSYLENTRYRYSGGGAIRVTDVLDNIRREWGIEIQADDVTVRKGVLPSVSLCRAVGLRLTR